MTREKAQERNVGKGIRLLKCERFLFNPQEFVALKAQRRYGFILPCQQFETKLDSGVGAVRKQSKEVKLGALGRVWQTNPNQQSECFS